MGLRKRHREAEVSTDSLNDIMFFLLLFFLILSTMVSPNSIKVNLPKSDPKVTLENTKKPIHLAVTKDHKYFIDNVEIGKEQVESILTSKSAALTEPTVLMHLDKDLTIQDQLDIMTICYKLNCKTVLATAATQK
jgi:biopolymer transport protein ExbD